MSEDGYEYAPLSEGCCLSILSDRQPGQHGPLIYLNVDGRIDEALEAAFESGGKILNKKEQVGSWGYRALILDSEGNSVALHSTKS